MTKNSVCHLRPGRVEHILEGTKNTIEILNDHWNLTYFWGVPEPELPTSMLVPLPVQV